MRKLMAIVLVVVLVFAMASVAFASGGNVVSPEKGNSNKPVTPSNGNKSHQTGEAFSVVWIVLAAVVLLGVAFFCGKKFVAVK